MKVNASLAKPRQISCVDLFCGAGGLTHGLVRSGIRVTAGVDLDPACRYPFEENNPGSKFVAMDIARLSGREVLRNYEKGSIKLLAGCAPCQPFSTYAQRYDIDRDNKWALLDEFGRIVREVEPDLVTMENVPALRDHIVFKRFVNMLERRNYFVWHDVVSCENYGVPQARKRTVLLASKFGQLEFSSRSRTKIKNVRDAIGSLPSLSAGEACPSDKLHSSSALSPLNLERVKASKPGGTWRDWPKGLVADCHKKDSGKTYPGVYGRMEWDKPAPTMTTQCFGFGNGRFGHPEQDRAISLREAALLQSFPRNYKFVPDDEPVQFKVLGRLIGNAVPVALGYAIGKSINEHLVEVGVLPTKRKMKH